ncbi:hypothetical protein C2I36_01195 [Rhodobacteraceae bacterium WD3A24]|nr:hypothetical protein C2I36_01195 [Rhodobacteraceae bacterium WD3A24]
MSSVKPRLGLSARQSPVLTPELHRALWILRLPAAGLHEALARAAADNPFLVYRPPARVVGGVGGAALAAMADRPGLLHSLGDQLAAMSLPSEARDAAACIAGSLDDDGMLDTPLGEISATFGLSDAAARAGLAAVQSCEPTGVGARSLAECLELQLRERGVDGALAGGLVAGMEAIARGDMAALSKRLGVPRQEAERLTALLRGLRSKPVETGDAPATALIPELEVVRGARGALDVVPLRAARPGLRLDAALAGKARAGGFSADMRRAAQALLRAVEMRESTLLRIGRAIVERQHRFFDEGAQALRPLSRAQLAQELALHPSTVGRSVSGKALSHEGRVIPLATFFSGALPEAAESSLSAAAVRARIGAMIAAEPPDAPLSDDAIRLRLEREGIDIARRTVAKYRGWLRLPSSAGRRRNRSRAAPHRGGS